MIKSFLKKYWWRYVVGSVFLIVVDILMIMVPRITGIVIDTLRAAPDDLSTVRVLLLGIVGIAFGLFLSRFFWRVFIMGAARRFEYFSKEVLFDKLLSLPASYYDRTRVGDLMARFTNDVNAMRMAFGPAIVMMVDGFFLTAITIVAMGSFVDWNLTLLSVAPLPALAFVATFFGRMIHRRFRAVQEAFSDVTDTAEESIAGVRVVKSYGIEQLRSKIMEGISNNYVAKNMALVKIWGMFFPMIQGLAMLGVVIAIFFGGRMVILGSITLGEFVTFVGYLGMLIWPIAAFGWVLNIIQRGRASYRRLKEIIEEKSDVKTVNPVKIRKLRGHIVFDNLTFTYPTGKESSLMDVSLEIKAGSKVALVGTTGSGKSTIGKLLGRVYPVLEGKIMIDGIDITRLDPEIIRDNIAYVPQETFLFSDTVRNNIAFAVDGVDKEEVEKYAKVAAVHNDIKGFSKGYDTIVGERGVTLSGGQKQRIAIARALMKEAPVIFLDDCLSAVDTETEARILKSLQNSGIERTIIVISHRLKAVVDSDVIYVMHDGKVVEQGTHSELLENYGLYRKMYDRQMLEEKLEGE